MTLKSSPSRKKNSAIFRHFYHNLWIYAQFLLFRLKVSEKFSFTFQQDFYEKSWKNVLITTRGWARWCAAWTASGGRPNVEIRRLIVVVWWTSVSERFQETTLKEWSSTGIQSMLENLLRVSWRPGLVSSRSHNNWFWCRAFFGRRVIRLNWFNWTVRDRILPIRLMAPH